MNIGLLKIQIHVGNLKCVILSKKNKNLTDMVISILNSNFHYLILNIKYWIFIIFINVSVIFLISKFDHLKLSFIGYDFRVWFSYMSQWNLDTNALHLFNTTSCLFLDLDLWTSSWEKNLQWESLNTPLVMK